MNKQLRKAVIAGNWKMNKTPSQTTALVEEMKPLVKDAGCDVVICVPYVDLQAALEATKGSNIKVGAENLRDSPRARVSQSDIFLTASCASSRNVFYFIGKFHFHT